MDRACILMHVENVVVMDSQDAWTHRPATSIQRLLVMMVVATTAAVQDQVVVTKEHFGIQTFSNVS